MKKYISLLGFGIWLLGFSFCYAAVVGSTDDAMTIGGGARPIGMGRTFTAIADDCDTIFLNPAGLASLKGPQAMSMFTNLLGEIYYMEVSGAVPSPFGTIGVGYITTGVNNIPTTPISTDYYDSLLALSYSTPLSRFFMYAQNVFVGVNYKIYNRGYTGGVNQFGSGMSMDLGLKYIVSPNLSLGINRQNFLPVSMGGVIRLGSGAEESLASITKVGIAVRPVFQTKLLVAADMDLPAQTGRPITSHFGIEWKENKYLTLRCGLDQSIDSSTPTKTSWNPAYGVSFGASGFRIDYAYHPYYNDSALATTYVSISYAGEPWFALKGKVE